MEKKRLDWLDCTRGIGIILVVLTHSATTVLRENYKLAKAIYEGSFFIDRQLLMVLSGYVFYLAKSHYKKLNNIEFFKKKVQRILVPYIVYSFIVYLFFQVINEIPFLEAIMEYSVYKKLNIVSWAKGILTGTNNYTLHLWFLYDLFIYVCITYILMKKFKNWEKIIVVSWGILTVLSYLLEWKQNGIIDNLIYFYTWFLMGIVLCPKIKDCKIWMWGIAIGYGYFILYHLFECERMENQILELLYQLTKGAAIIGIIQLGKELRGKILYICKYIGKNSMDIYLFSQPFFGSCIGVVGYQVFHLPVIVILIISITLSFIVPIIILKILTHTKYLKKLFGH